uniref:CASAMP N-terminal domain-containing protein n=1 Tax=Xiphophorus couchianus TaxID=32473 RepID=A0A3B5MIY1_9TELE
MVDSPSAMKKTFTVPEIKPLDKYDFARARMCASVRWLLSKSYGSAGTGSPPSPGGPVHAHDDIILS